MTTTKPSSGSTHCPECGAPLEIWPRLDGTGTVAICPKCSRGPTPLNVDAQPEEVETPRDPRLKDLLREAAAGEREPHSLDDLLEDLDPETRSLLKGEKPQRAEPALREDLAQSLRYQGYTVQEDARGVRIGGRPHSAGPSSPYDIVRMAAELEGGVPSSDERIRCPECDAVLPGDATSCQWCGADIPPQNNGPSTAPQA